VLIAYSDGSNTHIADVDLQTAGAASNTSTGMANIFASDKIQLTGAASDTALVGSNVHFIA